MNLHTTIDSYTLHTEIEHGTSVNISMNRVTVSGDNRVTSDGDQRIVTDSGNVIAVHTEKEYLVLHTEVTND